MSFLLDTNIVSELRKGTRANRGVRQWFEGADDEALFLSVLVVGELRQGIEGIRIRDPRTAQRLERWLRTLIENYESRIVPIDRHVADLWGRLNVPDPISAVDGLLAATAIVHDFTFVTRNIRDVQRTDVRTLDPFS